MGGSLEGFVSLDLKHKTDTYIVSLASLTERLCVKCGDLTACAMPNGLGNTRNDRPNVAMRRTDDTTRQKGQ